MSKTRRTCWAVAAVASMLARYSPARLDAAETPVADSAVSAAAVRNGAAVLETYAAAGAETFFAMKISPRVPQPKAAAHDVVVLFDTSASQTGAYREKALAALEALLAGF